MSLVLKAILDSSQAQRQFSQAVDKFSKNLDRLEKKSTKTSNKMSSRFRSLAGIAGIGSVALGLRAATREVVGFDLAMREVSTLIDTTTVSTAKLSKEVLNLSTKVPKSAIDLSKGLYQTISAGITDSAEAMTFLSIAAKAGVAGLTDTNTAVDALTSVINAYQLEASDAERVSNVFFETIRLGKTTFAELAPTIGRVTSIAAQVGVSFEEVTAGVVALTKAGVRTDNAIIALRQVLVSVLKPTGEAAKEAKRLGIEFDAEALKGGGLSGILDQLIQKAQGNSEAQTKLFGNVRALTGVMALAGSVSDDFTEALAANNKQADQLNVAYEKMAGATSNLFQLLKNELNVILQNTADEALPGVNASLKFLTIGIRNARIATSEWIDLPLVAQVKLLGAMVMSPVTFFEVRDALLSQAEAAKQAKKEIDALFQADPGATLLFGSEDVDKSKGAAKEVAVEVRDILRFTKERAATELSLLERAGELEAARIPGLTVTKEILEAHAMAMSQQVESTKILVSDLDIKRKKQAIEFKNEQEDSVLLAAQLANNFELAANAMARLVEEARRGSLSLSSILGIAALFPGPQQPFLAGGAALTSAFGFAHGGSFTVPGSGGTDSQAVAFNATPGERVTVQTPSQVNSNNNPNVTVPIQIFGATDFDVNNLFDIQTKLIPMINSALASGSRLNT